MPGADYGGQIPPDNRATVTLPVKRECAGGQIQLPGMTGGRAPSLIPGTLPDHHPIKLSMGLIRLLIGVPIFNIQRIIV